MKEDHLMLYDRYGKLLVKARRSRNRLYKVILEVESARCLQVAKLGTSGKWHARLGHVGPDTMKTKKNKDLVACIPKFTIDRETCRSGLLGKQVRKTFPKSTSFRANGILDLVHGDLCGPISPPTAAGNRYVFMQKIGMCSC